MQELSASLLMRSTLYVDGSNGQFALSKENRTEEIQHYDLVRVLVTYQITPFMGHWANLPSGQVMLHLKRSILLRQETTAYEWLEITPVLQLARSGKCQDDGTGTLST